MAALSGVRIVELGTWVAVPATGLILADWGAEVIKVEEPGGGDPLRSLVRTGFLAEEPAVNPVFQLENRGKRSVTVDLREAEQQRALHRLVETADVLVTNLRAPYLKRYGFAWEDLHERYPHLVYARLSGYGHVGEESDRPAYDYSAFWGRSGLLASMSPPGALADPRPGVGDHAAALALCSGILAALYERRNTGRGQAVNVSLYRTGVWLHGMEAQLHGIMDKGRDPDGDQTPNPLFSAYQTSDGRWFYLTLGQPDRDWEKLCAALGRPDLVNHASFATPVARARHAHALRDLLEETFVRRSLAEWAPVLDQHGIVWGPVRTVAEAVLDRQLRVSGGFRRVVAGTPVEVIAPPVDLSGATGPDPAPGAPALGEHNDILLENGAAQRAPTAVRSGGKGDLDLSKVGSRSREQVWTYGERDALLYNLSVGATEPRLVFEGAPGGLEIVPSFGVLPGLEALDWLRSILEVGPEEVILGEQELRLAGEIPPAGTLSTAFELTGVYDKGANALAVVTAASAQGGKTLCENVFRVFIKNGGGFGGDRGPEGLLGPWPSDEADDGWTFAAPASAPLLYRLNGDWHPVHADPEAAAAEGHPRPPLHGMYLLGVVCRRERERGTGQGRPLSLAIRYSGPAYPEEQLTFRCWRRDRQAFTEVFAEERGAAVCRIRVTHAQSGKVR